MTNEMKETNLVALQGKVFEGVEVDIIQDENGNPLFELYTTGMALGYVKYKTVKGKTYTEIRKKRIDKVVENAEISTFPHRGEKYLTEENLYDFMLEAKTEKCKGFRKWVTKEVLPSIRKHGAYITEKTLDEMLADPDNMIKVLTTLKEEKEKNAKLENEITTMLPKVSQYDDLMNSHDMLSMNETAKSIGVGRNDLFKLLRNKGVLMSDKKIRKIIMCHIKLILIESILLLLSMKLWVKHNHKLW